MMTNGRAHIGVRPNTFDRMVADGMMPKPTQVYGRKLWDVRKLHQLFEALLADGESAQANPFD